MKPKVYVETTIISYLAACRELGYEAVIFCTPEELMEA